MKVMKIILAVAVCFGLFTGIGNSPEKVKAKSCSKAESSLIVEFKPSVLTAGVINELIDVREPFTIIVRDSQGNPVDLTNGGKNDAKTVWNKCFADPHPDNQEYYGKDAKLPRYYWTRTDMHNDDGTAVCSKKLFGKDFIEIDFSQAKEGRYVFKNFVANSIGDFKVFVKTLDGVKSGECEVRVDAPNVEYTINNVLDYNQVEYNSPGDPDFVLTAADNRIYKVRTTCWDVSGRLIRGNTRGVSVCGGGVSDVSRLTLFLKAPGNTFWAKKPDIIDAKNVYGPGNCKYLTNTGERYGLNIGFDFNGDESITIDDNELFAFEPQKVYDITNKKWTQYLTYYSSFNTYSESKGYSTVPVFDMPAETKSGWGLGCIYNRLFEPGTTFYESDEHGVMFANLDDDPRITYNDSIGLNMNAQTEFYLFAQDVAYLGCLVGCSMPDIYDFAGCPPPSPTSPDKVVTRYKPDGTYCLDFDTMARNKVLIGKPEAIALWSQTHEEITKDNLGYYNYDLLDNIENSFIFQITPADWRDMPMHPGATISITDKMGRELSARTTQVSSTDDKAVEALFSITPTINGEGVYSAKIITDNQWYQRPPYNSDVFMFKVENICQFDIVPALMMMVAIEKTEKIGTMKLTITCTDSSSRSPVAGARVKLTGGGVDYQWTTDSNGQVIRTVTFSESGKVKISASYYFPNTCHYSFDLDVSQVTPPSQNAIPPTLIRPANQTTLDSSLMPNKLTFEWNKPANWNNTMEYILEISKWDSSIGGLKPVAKYTFLTSKDDVEIRPYDEINVITNTKGFSLDYGTKYYWHVASRFTTGNKTAPEWSLIWEFTTPAKTQENSTPCPECYVTMDFKIGSKDWTVCGQPKPQMSAAPVIKNGKTFLVIKYIAETIGATVNWYEEQRVVEIISPSDLTTIYLQIDNNKAEVNGQLVPIDEKNKDVKPFILGGRTMLPLRFIGENLGLEIQWNGQTNTASLVGKTPECKPKFDFTLKDTEGKNHTLSSYRGKPVILDFTASWCGWCIKAAPDLDAVAKKYKGKVQVLSIDMGEDQATAKNFKADLKADWPFLVDKDKKVSGQFKVNGIPHFVILDGNGVTRFVQSGYNDKIVEIFSKEIEKLLR